MAKTKQKQVKILSQSDSTYFLKLVLYLVVGTQWIFFVNPDMTSQFPLPLGLIVGLFFTTRERFKIDRKIEYAVLLVATMVGFWSNIGIYITTLK
jgi:hypothetical protein